MDTFFFNRNGEDTKESNQAIEEGDNVRKRSSVYAIESNSETGNSLSKSQYITPVKDNIELGNASGEHSRSNSKDHLNLISASQPTKTYPSLVLETNDEDYNNSQRMLVEEEVLIQQQEYISLEIINHKITE